MIKLIEQLQQLERLDALIRRKSTGSPKELARKFSVSERTVYNLLEGLKLMGAEIEYCHSRCSYCYKTQMEFRYGYTLSPTHSRAVNGGQSFFGNFQELQNICRNALHL